MLKLTERQREVLHLLVGGLSEKEIAAELKISPSRVTQHVRALKDRLGTESRRGLVAAAKHFPACEKLTGQNIPVPGSVAIRNATAGAAPDQIVFADAMPLRLPAPWESDAYRVGPGAFDGPGGNWLRIAAIVATSLGIPILLVLGISAWQAIVTATTSTP